MAAAAPASGIPGLHFTTPGQSFLSNAHKLSRGALTYDTHYKIDRFTLPPIAAGQDLTLGGTPYRLFKLLGKGSYGQVWLATGGADSIVAIKFLTVTPSTIHQATAEVCINELMYSFAESVLPSVNNIFPKVSAMGYDGLSTLCVAISRFQETFQDYYRPREGSISMSSIAYSRPDLVDTFRKKKIYPLITELWGLMKKFFQGELTVASNKYLSGHFVGLAQVSFRFIHNDLKPDNFYLTDNEPGGRRFLRVADFGLSRLVINDVDINANAARNFGNPSMLRNYIQPCVFFAIFYHVFPRVRLIVNGWPTFSPWKFLYEYLNTAKEAELEKIYNACSTDLAELPDGADPVAYAGGSTPMNNTNANDAIAAAAAARHRQEAEQAELERLAEAAAAGRGYTSSDLLRPEPELPKPDWDPADVEAFNAKNPGEAAVAAAADVAAVGGFPSGASYSASTPTRDSAQNAAFDAAVKAARAQRAGGTPLYDPDFGYLTDPKDVYYAKRREQIIHLSTGRSNLGAAAAAPSSHRSPGPLPSQGALVAVEKWQQTGEVPFGFAVAGGGGGAGQTPYYGAAVSSSSASGGGGARSNFGRANWGHAAAVGGSGGGGGGGGNPFAAFGHGAGGNPFGGGGGFGQANLGHATAAAVGGRGGGGAGGTHFYHVPGGGGASSSFGGQLTAAAAVGGRGGGGTAPHGNPFGAFADGRGGDGGDAAIPVRGYGRGSGGDGDGGRGGSRRNRKSRQKVSKKKKARKTRRSRH